MAPDLSNEAWAQIRYDYEHTGRSVGDICAEHGISSGTLRDRMRRWGWARRRVPIPQEGPPPLAPTLPSPASGGGIKEGGVAAPPLPIARALDIASPSPMAPSLAAVPHAAAGDGASAPGEPDNGAIAPRLQSAAQRVLPAIEATVAKLAAGPMPPREMEQAARALSSLTRTLRELNGLLGQHRALGGDDAADDYDDDMPADIDAFRLDLARRIDAFVASRTGEAGGGTEPEGT